MAAEDNLGNQFKDRLGRCFELSGREQMDKSVFSGDDDHLLHHGSIQGLGNPRISHAWVEHKETGHVWEPITNQHYDSQTFKSLFNAESEHAYPWKEAKEHIFRTKHWGPWEEMNQP